jgi:hypothetical protein
MVNIAESVKSSYQGMVNIAESVKGSYQGVVNIAESVAKSRGIAEKLNVKCSYKARKWNQNIYL